MIRALAAGLGGFLICAAWADRLLEISTGTKISKRVARVELQSWQGAGRVDRWFLGHGLGENFDFEAVLERRSKRGRVASIDFSYNYLTPVVDVSPGISVGLLDTAGVTERGRTGYVAATWRFAQDSDDVTRPLNTEFTIGYQMGGTTGLIFGFSLPLSQAIRLIAEYPTRDLSAGIELRPLRPLSLKWVFGQNRTLLSASWTHRL